MKAMHLFQKVGAFREGRINEGRREVKNLNLYPMA